MGVVPEYIHVFCVLLPIGAGAARGRSTQQQVKELAGSYRLEVRPGSGTEESLSVLLRRSTVPMPFLLRTDLMTLDISFGSQSVPESSHRD